MGKTTDRMTVNGVEYEIMDAVSRAKIGDTELPTTAQTLTEAVAKHENEINNLTNATKNIKSICKTGDVYIGSVINIESASVENATRVDVESAQVFESVYSVDENHGISIIKNEDGSYTINGTADATTTYHLNKRTRTGTDNPIALSGYFTYKVQFVGGSISRNSLNETDNLARFGIKDGDNIVFEELIYNENPADVKVTESFNCENCIVYFKSKNGATYNNLTFTIMLNPGTESIKYAKYKAPTTLGQDDNLVDIANQYAPAVWIHATPSTATIKMHCNVIEYNEAIEELEKRTTKLENGTSNDIITLNNGVKTKILQGRMRKNVLGNYDSLPPVLTLLHFSDIHGNKNNLKRIVEFASFYSNVIDDVICTGDMAYNVYADGMSFWSNVNGAENILMCIGNHDVAVTGQYASYGVTPEQAYNQYFAPYISNWNVEYSNSLTYYYKDYVNQKIRLIALDYMLTGTNADNQAQWLETVLEVAKINGYAVVCIDHDLPGSTAKIDCTFTSIINTKSGSLESAYQEKVQSFIDEGGVFLCWLCGHVHNDFVVYNNNYPKQPFIAVTDSKGFSGYENAARVTDDKSQDAFNIVCLDAGSRLVKLVRVGQDRDSMMRSLNTLTMDVSQSPASVIWND